MAQIPVSVSMRRENLWRRGDFLKLWLATTVSLLGSEFTGLAIPLIAVLTLGATPAQMGFLDAARYLPFLLIGLFAGVWADRHRKRPILIGADLCRALLLLSIPAAAVLGALTLLQLYLVILLVGGLSVFFDVAYQAYLPALVERDQLGEANGKLESGRSGAKLIGPALAGIVIQIVSAPLAIVLDVSSFVASAVFLGIVRQSEADATGKSRAPLLAEAREGLSVVFGDPVLRSIVGCTASLNFFIMAVNALYVLYATRGLGVTPGSLGLILGLGNAGTLAGALVTGRVARRLGFGRLLIIASGLIAAGHVPILLATRANAVPVLTAGYVIFCFASMLYGITSVSVRQALIPLHLQGRAAASSRVLIYGIIPLGGIVGGLAGQSLGTWTTIALCTVGMLASTVLILRAPILGLARLPTPP
ncbi:MAG TPA: MFS transporter [Chloroflexota bacterium]|nr:MFS transporter [Chloroflexota bacterium]